MRIYNVSQRRLRKTRPFANTAVVEVCQSFLVRIPGFHLATLDCAFSFLATLDCAFSFTGWRNVKKISNPQMTWELSDIPKKRKLPCHVFKKKHSKIDT